MNIEEALEMLAEVSSSLKESNDGELTKKAEAIDCAILKIKSKSV